MIDHLGVRFRLRAHQASYLRVLAPLGYQLVFEHRISCAWAAAPSTRGSMVSWKSRVSD
jgi:hypothetical protein